MIPRSWRPERCAICKKMQGHEIHQVAPRLRWWQRLLRLAWPRWTWGEADGRHEFVSDAPRAAAAEAIHKLKGRLARQRRAS